MKFADVIRREVTNLKKLLRKMITVFIASTLIFSSFHSSVVAQESNSSSSTSAPAITQEQVKEKVQEGYSLFDIQTALISQKVTGEDYETILKNRKRIPLNLSSTEKSRIESELPQTYTERIGSSPIPHLTKRSTLRQSYPTFK